MFFALFVSFGEANKTNKQKTNREWWLCGITQIKQNKNKLYLKRVTFDSCRNW